MFVRETKLSLEDFYRDLESLKNYDPSDISSKGRVEYFKSVLNGISEFIGEKVLDLACGGGITSIILGKMGKTVVGVDVQEDMLNIARRNASDLKNVKFVKMDITDMNLGETFDTVLFMGNSIVHFSLGDFELILGTVKKHLKKGGSFILEFSDFIWEQLKRGGEFVKSVSGKKVSFSYNYESGCISVLVIKEEIRDDLVEAERHCYYLWAPWLVRFLLNKGGFKLLSSMYSSAGTFIEVYRLI